MSKLKIHSVTLNGTLKSCVTPSELRSIAKLIGTKSSQWVTIARALAKKAGGVLVLRADASLVIFTRLESGKVSQATYAEGRYTFAG